MLADIPNKQGMGSFIKVATGSLQTLLRLALVSNKVLQVALVPGVFLPKARASDANIGINLHLLVVLGYDESNH
jgi:hypothetical protein